MGCPFCNSSVAVSTFYPTSYFNKKFFTYIKCKNCRLVYLSNYPDKDDYVAMYPPSYQKDEVITTIEPDPFKKLPGLRFSYGFQFDLIRKQIGTGSKILDYGCGNGHFIANAIHHGFHCDGAEFNKEYINRLKAGIPEATFYSVDELLTGDIAADYDVIRLSNVLEHITEPAIVLNKLKKNLKPGGIILIEGPVEENFSLATAFRKTYFRVRRLLKPVKTVSSPPYHIFFSNRKNQRNFFSQMDFTETHFSISEDPWPFPASFRQAKGVKEKITALIAKLSILFSRLFNKNWGNIFIYTGTK